MVEVTVRIAPVSETDSEAILEVYRQCEDFLALGPEPHASMEMVLADLRHSAETGGVFCGIWDSGGALVGVVDYAASMHSGNPEQAYISLLMIAASARGKGIGAEVVALIESETGKTPGVKSIACSVQENNPAMGFWRKMGYLVVSGPEVQPDTTVTYTLRKGLLEG